MNRPFSILIIVANFICLGWLSFLLLLSPANAKPLEGLIANKKYDQVVETGIEIVKQQANGFYYPSVILIVVNICLLFTFLINKKAKPGA